MRPDLSTRREGVATPLGALPDRFVAAWQDLRCPRAWRRLVVAVSGGADSLALLHLLHDRREGLVLDLVAARSGWGTALPPAADGAKKARGVALHESFGSTVAQVAEVSVGSDGAIRVHRVTCAIDCGIPVNPATIAQQMEGSVVFGLTAALHGRIDIDQGRVQQGNFHEYAALRMAECPVIETHIVPSARPPEGVGEPGVPRPRFFAPPLRFAPGRTALFSTASLIFVSTRSRKRLAPKRSLNTTVASCARACCATSRSDVTTVTTREPLHSSTSALMLR